MTLGALSTTLRQENRSMQNIVIDKPYVPIPPHHMRIWPAILSLYVPRLLARKYGVTHVECLHVERLKQSISAGHGVLLAPNHCREEDPLVLGILSRASGSPFFIMASWHVFMQDKLTAFLLRRAAPSVSIARELIAWRSTQRSKFSNPPSARSLFFQKDTSPAPTTL